MLLVCTCRFFFVVVDSLSMAVACLFALGVLSQKWNRFLELCGKLRSQRSVYLVPRHLASCAERQTPTALTKRPESTLCGKSANAF